MDGKLQEARVKQIMLADDGTFANNPMLPLLLYSGVFLPCGADPASEVEARFDANGWPAAWRNGIYACHPYHSEAHEALGVYRGSAEVQFGGPNRSVAQIAAGDAAVLPAGRAHKLIAASRDFAVVGAYPPGQRPDMCYGKRGERPGADERMARVPIPGSDPVFGAQGGLLNSWLKRPPP
jgi:uncharacterized protein YjlB